MTSVMLGLLNVENNNNTVEISPVNDLSNSTSVMLGLLNVENNKNTYKISPVNCL